MNKRAPGESFEDYRERRKGENKVRKMLGNIKVFFSGGTYRRKERVPIFKPILVSRAVGKRHQGESLEHFKERRKVCNTKRRLREKTRYANSNM